MAPWSRLPEPCPGLAGRGELKVALVHRPRYDDWSWAKGKLDPGEEWPVAAVREVFEETGLHVRLGRPLPSAAYTVLSGSGPRVAKEVRYWAAEVVGGDGSSSTRSTRSSGSTPPQPAPGSAIPVTRTSSAAWSGRTGTGP
jgi:ADP-ribose pyrophosphatase YjhB (NUDIX family)